jgi:hypothetical protein
MPIYLILVLGIQTHAFQPEPFPRCLPPCTCTAFPFPEEKTSETKKRKRAKKQEAKPIHA